MLAYLFVIFAVVARMPFMPHPWNFTPVAAALLYFGARGSRRQLWVPFALLAASDVILTIVGTPADVRALYLGEEGLIANARPGSTLVDMTTSSPSLAMITTLSRPKRRSPNVRRNSRRHTPILVPPPHAYWTDSR